MGSIKKIFESYFGSIVFACCGVLYIPINLYISNVGQFAAYRQLLLAPFIASLSILLISVVLRASHKRLQYILLGLGFSILLSDQFLRSHFSLLDGSKERFDQNPFLMIANLTLYFGIPILLFILGHKIKKVLVNISYFIAFGFLGLTVYAYLLSPNFDNSNFTTQRKVRSSHLPNVYLIWLDALENTNLSNYLKTQRAEYDGFVNFRNNTSNYLYTNFSIKSFMSGTLLDDFLKLGVYQNNKINSLWSKKADRLTRILKSTGYHITSYTERLYRTASVTSKEFISQKSIFQEHTHTSAYQSDFVSYWILRTLPSAFSNRLILAVLKHSMSWIFSAFSNSRKIPHSISAGIEPYSGVLILNRARHDENTRGSYNEFVIIHAIIPHGPYVINKDCHFLHKGTSYDAQVRCAMRLTHQFLRKLKSLNRYKNSLILILGDHGSGWQSAFKYHGKTFVLNKRFMPWTNAQVISRSLAGLMIKPPGHGQGTPLQVRNIDSQLIDLFPTILSSLGLKKLIGSDVVGRDLFSSPLPNRLKKIFYFKPGNYMPPNSEIYNLIYTRKHGVVGIKKHGKLYPITSPISGSKYFFSSLVPSFSIENDNLSHIESWGRWSDGPTAQFKLQLEKAFHPKAIKFHLNAFVTSKNKEQTASVYIIDKSNNIDYIFII